MLNSNKKAAIGLSMEILVVVIISIVILVAGITLLRQLIGGAEDIKAGLDQRTNEELERLLVDQGQPVATSIDQANLNRGESYVFGLGIRNIDATQFGTQFKIDLNLIKVVDSQNNDITAQLINSASSWALYNSEEITILENENRKEPISIDIPSDAPKGEYFFNAKVFTADGTQYYHTQRFQVSVK